MRSLLVTDLLENEKSGQRAKKARNCKEPILVVNMYKRNVGSQIKGIVKLTFYRGETFKRFKESEIFVEMIMKLGVSQSTVFFKINLFKVLDKYLIL